MLNRYAQRKTEQQEASILTLSIPAQVVGMNAIVADAYCSQKLPRENYAINRIRRSLHNYPTIMSPQGKYLKLSNLGSHGNQETSAVEVPEFRGRMQCLVLEGCV